MSHRVRDVLRLKSGSPVVVAPSALLAEATELMVKHDIGSVMVTEGARLVGIVTFREVLRAHAEGADPARTAVSALMERSPLVLGLDDSVDMASRAMTERHARYVPVVENGELRGVVSFHDIARARLHQASCENRLLRRVIGHQSAG